MHLWMGYHESVIGVSGSYFKFVKQKKLAEFFKFYSKINWIYTVKKHFPGQKKVYNFFQQNLSEKKY